MSVPRAVNLNFRVPWQGVCASLGIAVESQALPMRTRCPLCFQDALQIFHDNNAGGAWHQCRSCGSGGDMLELASAVWKTEPGDTLKRLAADGVQMPEVCLEPAAIAGYIARPTSRRVIGELWADAKNHFMTTLSGTTAALRRQFNLGIESSQDRWKAGPGQLIGSAHKRLINAAFNPGTGHYDRTFKGPKWDEIMMTPFYDLPDRIRAMAFIGRGGDRNLDSAFCATPFTVSPVEAGIGLLPAVGMAGDPDAVLAVGDWLFALQVQMRHMRTSLKTLPLVAWHDDGKRRTGCWQILAGRKIVFWAHSGMDHRVIRQAMECNGHISVMGPADDSPETVAEYLRLRRSTDELRRNVLSAAVPWQQACRSWFRNEAKESQRMEVIARLEQSGADVSALFREIGNGAVTAMKVTAVPKMVQVNQYEIVEQGDVWLGCTAAAGRRRMPRHEIMNCTLRLLYAIKDTQKGELFYYGRIGYKGTELFFIEKLSVVQHHRRGCEWLQMKLAESNLGVLSVDPRWTTRVHQIAVAMHTPKFIEDDLYKWVEKMRRLNKDNLKEKNDRRSKDGGGSQPGNGEVAEG